MSPNTKLSVDVYVVPVVPTVTGSQEANKQWWSPISCTLIHTAHSAILIDTSPSMRQTEDLADWIDKTAPGVPLKYFFTTHAHADHFAGVPILQRRYPGIKAVATAKVLPGVMATYDDANLRFWQGLWPGDVSDEKPTFEALAPSNEIDFDGFQIKAYDVVQGDSSANSFLHVPDLDLIVAGDLVYGDCYQYLAEANTKEKRANWIKAVEQIEALRPQIVIPGHKRTSQIDGAYLTSSTKQYILVFGEELEKSETAEALEKRMKELYPERWNDYILQASCQASFANKGQ